MRPRAECAAIIGLGQIGGSLAMALKQARFFSRLGGYDKNASRLELAKSFLDCSFQNPEEAIRTSDVIILALPIQSILKILEMGFREFPEKLFTDVGSTKTPMLELARRFDHPRFVGGHPLAGSEKEGEAGWNGSLFEKRPYYLVSDSDAAKADQELVVAMTQAIGAVPYFISAPEHDRAVALTSHLPLLISLALMARVVEKNDYSSFMGSGFQSAARLAGGPAEMGRDLLISNRKNILRELQRFISHLESLKGSLERLEESDLLEKMKQYQELYWQLMG